MLRKKKLQEMSCYGLLLLDDCFRHFIKHAVIAKVLYIAFFK